MIALPALLIGVVFHSAATGTAIDGQVHVPRATTKPVPANPGATGMLIRPIAEMTFSTAVRNSLSGSVPFADRGVRKVDKPAIDREAWTGSVGHD